MPSSKFGNEPGRTLEHGYLRSMVLIFQQERRQGGFTGIGMCKNQTRRNMVVSHERGRGGLFILWDDSLMLTSIRLPWASHRVRVHRLLPTSQVRIWYPGSTVKPGNEAARCCEKSIEVDDRSIGNVSFRSFIIVGMSRARDLCCLPDPSRAFFDATFHSHVSRVSEMERENGHHHRSQYNTE
jgi:hypothetical protein